MWEEDKAVHKAVLRLVLCLSSPNQISFDYVDMGFKYLIFYFEGILLGKMIEEEGRGNDGNN